MKLARIAKQRARKLVKTARLTANSAVNNVKLAKQPVNVIVKQHVKVCVKIVRQLAKHASSLVRALPVRQHVNQFVRQHVNLHVKQHVRVHVRILVN